METFSNSRRSLILPLFALLTAACSSDGPHAPTGGTTTSGKGSSGASMSSNTSTGVGGAGGANGFGGYTLTSLDEPCEGVSGLTGNAVLAQKLENSSGTFEFLAIDAQGNAMPNGTSALTIGVAWPAVPVATCFPAFTNADTTVTPPRVGIFGLKLSFSTADGKFAENLDAIGAVFETVDGKLSSTQILAATLEEDLSGTYDPNVTFVPGNYAGSGYLFAVAGTPMAAHGVVGLTGDGALLAKRTSGLLTQSGFAIGTF